MITAEEAAQQIGVSVIRIRQLLQQRRIVGARKLGRVWFVPERVIVDPPLKEQHRRK